MPHSDYVRYMQRTRDYYRAQGFEDAYRWAQVDAVPFTPLSKPPRDSVER